MMDKIERFKRRQQRKKDINERKMYLVPDEYLINKHLNSSTDDNLIYDIENQFDYVYKFEYNTDVSDVEAKELLDVLEKDFDEQKFNLLLKDCKSSVIQSIVTPFGLGDIISKFDKNGGNVDTIHNARDGVYATDEGKRKYDNRGDYNSFDYHGDVKYIKKNRADAQKQKNGQLYDDYTGDKLGIKSKRDLDHTISAREIHDDPGRVLAEKNGVELANSESNLTSTERSINRAKGARSTDEFLDYLDRTREQRRKKDIEILKSKKILTDQERKKLKKLESLESVDAEKLKQIDRKARIEYNKILTKEYYTSKKFIKNTAIASTKEGVKMGVQQAIGLLLTEFFTATFDEISDIYRNGYKIENADFLENLKIRLKRIASKIANRWKDVTVAFSQDFISGFLSNLVTVVINMFVRTGKRIVRIIREGFFSLLRAIKLICFPPKGMTFAQAAHEASKLIASGLVIIGGIAIEEAIDAWIKGTAILEPLSDVITTVLMGSLTGIATTFIVYAIDKIDFSRVNDKEKHLYIMNSLEAKLNSMFVESEYLIEQLEW